MSGLRFPLNPRDCYSAAFARLNNAQNICASLLRFLQEREMRLRLENAKAIQKTMAEIRRHISGDNFLQKSNQRQKRVICSPRFTSYGRKSPRENNYNEFTYF